MRPKINGHFLQLLLAGSHRYVYSKGKYAVHALPLQYRTFLKQLPLLDY